jgi:multiple inositol-polyphosphate phosphatase/2,3-bisphosphoglycerate 3-phosphatase
VSVPSAPIYHFAENWNASEIIPLSANIQWILYSNGKHWLVKVMLNEKEVALPLETTTFPNYDWTNLRNYYLRKLSRLHVSLADNTHRYLLNLK